VEKIDDPSLLNWSVQKKKNSQIVTAYLPCGIRANPDERMDIGLTFDQHHELIRYVGVNYKDAGLLERVTRNKLVPYCGSGPEEDVDRSVWSPKFLKMHLESMRTRPEFQENTELKLRVEELALQYMLNEVLARYEEKQSQAAAAKSKAAETENVPPKLSPAVWKSPPKAAGTGSPKPTPTHVHVPFAAALEDRPKQKLRAGDVIAYFHPVMQRERCEGVIVTVNPPRSKDHNIAIVMQDSTLLPPTCHVKLMFRRLNKKLVEPRDKRAFYEEISAFQLDPSQNGKVEVATKTDELGRAYREMQNDLKDCQNDFWRDNAKRKQKDVTDNVQDDNDDTAENCAPSTPERSSKPAAVATPVSKTKSTASNAPRRFDPEPVKSVWRAQIEELLELTRQKRKVKRHDKKLVNAKEAALLVAIQAREHLELLSQRENQTYEELVDGLADDFSSNRVRLLCFLKGDENNLIKVDNIIQDTKEWEDWLNMQCAVTAKEQQHQEAPVTIVRDAAGQPIVPSENRALAKSISVERVEMAQNCDSDKLLSSAVVNTQPSSETIQTASLMDTNGDKMGKAPMPLALQLITKPSSKSPRKSAVSKAQLKSRPPRKPIVRSSKTKAPSKETKAAWIDGMEELLADVRKRGSLRCNREEIDAKEEALKVAIQARLKLEDEGRREKNSKEELLDELEELFGVPKERLRGFLNGNRNNLIKVGDLMELTGKWKIWLSSGRAQGTTASARSDGLVSHPRQESASVGSIEDVATNKMPIEDAAVPSVDLEPSKQQEAAPDWKTASDNAAAGKEPIGDAAVLSFASEPSMQQESAPGGNRASDNTGTGEEPMEGVDGLGPSTQQESVPGETRASGNVAAGEEPIEGAKSSTDGLEPSAQQGSLHSGIIAGDHVATSEEPIVGATASIDVLEPSAHQESASFGTRTSEQAPLEHTHLVSIQRVKEMASNELRRMENAKRKYEQLEVD
jgi:hypothetical protein